MKYLALIPAILLVGCSSSSPPNPVQQELVLDKHVQPLSRNEVIYAVRECETNK